MKLVSCGFWSLVVISGVMVACGGTAPKPAETPAPAPEVSSTAPKEEVKVEAPPEQKPSESAEATFEPTFRPNMSVSEAVAAVPQDLPRLNIEQEALAAPLVDVSLYDPCSLKPSQHFSADVAIWDGHPVGIDVSTNPVNEQVAACVRDRIEHVVWREKARSLNTVSFKL